MTTTKLLKLLFEIDEMLANASIYDPSGYNAEWKDYIVDGILEGKFSEKETDEEIQKLHRNLYNQGNGILDEMES